jgi:hypothetical protein
MSSVNADDIATIRDTMKRTRERTTNLIAIVETKNTQKTRIENHHQLTSWHDTWLLFVVRGLQQSISHKKHGTKIIAPSSHPIKNSCIRKQIRS